MYSIFLKRFEKFLNINFRYFYFCVSFVYVYFQKIKDFVVKIVLKKVVEDEDIFNDIKQLGELIQILLKNYKRDLMEICNIFIE